MYSGYGFAFLSFANRNIMMRADITGIHLKKSAISKDCTMS